MFSIIAKPENNELELAKKAKLLGYTTIYFSYPFQKIPKEIAEEIKKTGLVVKKLVWCNKTEYTIVKKDGLIPLLQSPDREVFEKMKDILVYDVENTPRNDGIHQRISGLNQVLCKLANKNNITLLYDVQTLKKIDSTLLAISVGRIQQNMGLCQKYKVKISISAVVSKPEEILNPYDIIALGKVLGLAPGEAKKAVSFVL